MENTQERGKSTTDKDKQDKEERKTQPDSSVGTFLAPHNRKRFHMTPFCVSEHKESVADESSLPGPRDKDKNYMFKTDFQLPVCPLGAFFNSCL